MSTRIQMTTAPPPSDPNLRLSGLDALRGVAAVMVMMFHYTTRYDEKFGHRTATAFSVPWGHLGVNLFFMISGFVIFMTLERTTRPTDFLISRFSRLFPAYWVAVAMTFSTLAVFPELGKEVSLMQAIENALMFQGLLGIANIDSVYWTLEVELLFYWAMFFLWLAGGFARPARWIAAWLALCIGFGLARRAGHELPYLISHMLILPYFAYFALGILLYSHFRTRAFRWSIEGALGAMAFAAIILIDSPERVLWACGFVAVFFLFTTGAGSSRLVVWVSKVGAISYPLYLLHENMGWTLIWHLEAHGMGSNASIALTCVAAIALAVVMRVAVEKPAMLAIRGWRKRKPSSVPSIQTGSERRRWIVGALMIGVLVLVGNRLTQHSANARATGPKHAVTSERVMDATPLRIDP